MIITITLHRLLISSLSQIQYQIATVTQDGVKIEENQKLKTDWKIAHHVNQYD